MKTKLKTNLIFLFALAFGLSSCTERIELELNEDENVRLVVEGWISNQQQKHLVKLTKTTSYFQNETPPKATGAVVSISDGTNVYPLSEEEPGMYYTDSWVAGEFGKTYTLNIQYEDETYTASSFLDTVPQIDSLAAEYQEFPDEPEENYYELLLWTQELPGQGDHYMWRIFKNGELQTDTLFEVTFVEDDFVDGNYIPGWNFDYVDAVPGDSIRVEQMAINSEANDIFIAIMLETFWRGGPFDTPPANVPSNISNGALGYFGATGVAEATILIDE